LRLQKRSLRIQVVFTSILFVSTGLIFQHRFYFSLGLCMSFIVCYGYFMACTPMPPGESRLGAFIGRFRLYPSSAPVHHGA
jgi:hypothetical protein